MYICWCVAEINYKMHGATVKIMEEEVYLLIVAGYEI